MESRGRGLGLLGAAALLLAWTCWIGATLTPDGPRQSWSAAWTGLDNWNLTWVGLDLVEVLGLAVTGSLLLRGRDARTAALLTAPVFVLDAWFDVMTSATTAALAEALVLAVCIEVPAAVVLVLLGGRPAQADGARVRSGAASPG